MVKYNTLQDRLHQQLSAGEASIKQARMTRFLEIADIVAQQTRLMHFKPSESCQKQHHNWLKAINFATNEIIGYLAKVSFSNVTRLKLPSIDFTELRNYQADIPADAQILQAHAYINKLEIIYIALQGLASPSELQQSHKTAHTSAKQRRILWARQWHKFSRQWTIKSNYFRHAFRGALCLTLGLVIVRALNLEFGFWTLMTSLLVLKPNLSMTWNRLLSRLAGTLVGILVVGFMLESHVSDTILPIVYCIAAVVFFHTSARKYSVAVFAVTIFVFCAFSLNGQGSMVILPRIENTLLGVALPILCVLLISPGFQKHSFPTKFADTIASYQQFFAHMTEFLRQSSEDEKAKLNQYLNASVINDTNLFDHWLGYLGEPKQHGRTAENMLLCCHTSNIMLRIVTLLNEQSMHSEQQKNEVIAQLALTRAAFLTLHKKLSTHLDVDSFFSHINNHATQINLLIAPLADQITQTDPVYLLKQLELQAQALS